MTNKSLFTYPSPTPSRVAVAQRTQLGSSLSLVTSVRCEGYADYGVGGTSQLLSVARARSVCALIDRVHPGIAPLSVGYGATDPVIVGVRPRLRAQNRRVVVVVTGSDVAPDAPTITAATAGDTTAALTFDAPVYDGGTAVTGYELSTDGGTTWTALTTSGPGPYSLRVHGLVNGITYSLETRAVNAAGFSRPSRPARATPVAPIGPGVAGPPTLSAADPGNTTATVTFTAPDSNGGDPILGYRVSTDDGINWVPYTPSGPGPYSDLVTGLTNGVVVEAVNSVGDSVPSISLDVTPVGVPVVAGAPVLSAATTGNTTAAIAFSAPSSNGGAAVTVYQVSLNGRSTSAAVTFAGSGPYTATLTGLVNGTTYPVTVRAVNSVGDGPASNSLNVTPAAGQVPSAPVLTAANQTYNSPFADADLSWPTPAANGSPISSYLVSVDSGPYVAMASYVAGSPNTDTEEVAYDGISSPTYTFTIKAVNANGDSATSNPAIFNYST